jgi:hypothetical protein
MALPLETAKCEFDDAWKHLRAALRAVSELRIAANMGQPIPDITADAAWLINTGRYDHARNLITLHENLIEAGVNYRIAEHNRDYDGVVSDEPGYLTSGEDDPPPETVTLSEIEYREVVRDR